MISNNYIPEKINEYNAYLDGTKMIGVAASVTLPEVNMKTSTVSGVGVNGELDSPTIGQFESMEQEIQFNTLYSSAMDMLSPLSTVNLTLRASQQVYDKQGGYNFKGLRVVEIGRVKKFNPGKVEKGEAMEATVTLELTYLMIEVDGQQLLEVDKLNGIYKVNGTDMLAGVNSLIERAQNTTACPCANGGGPCFHTKNNAERSDNQWQRTRSRRQRPQTRGQKRARTSWSWQGPTGSRARSTERST